MGGRVLSTDRRRASRRRPHDTEPLARVRLRTGRELAVIDLSDTGALVQGAARLLPGTHLDVHVVTRAGRILVRSRVVRAFVWQLEADAVVYRGAIAFGLAVDTRAGYGVPAGGAAVEGEQGTVYPAGIAAESSPAPHRLTA